MSDDNPNIVRVPRTRVGIDQVDLRIEKDGELYSSMTALKQSAGFDESAAHGSVDVSALIDFKLAQMPMTLLEYSELVSKDALVNVRFLESQEEGVRTDMAADKAELRSEMAADKAELEGELAAEQARAEGVESDLQDAITAEETRALAAEGVLTADLASEVATRTSEITRLDGRVDSVLSNIDPAALDSLTEVVTAFQGADSDLNDAISALTTDASNDRAAIRSEFAAADDVVRGEFAEDLAGERTQREAADAGLQTSLDSEVARAQEAENALAADLGSEISRAQAAESALQDAIDLEAESARAAELVLTNDLAAEVARAQAAEAANADNISGLSDSLQSEVTRASEAEAANAQAIQDEAGRASAAEEANTQAIIGEATRAQEAEGVLTSNLAAEVADRAAGDAALQAALDAHAAANVESFNIESTQRAAGDAAAMAGIDAEAALRQAGDEAQAAALTTFINTDYADFVSYFDQTQAEQNGLIEAATDDRALIRTEMETESQAREAAEAAIVSDLVVHIDNFNGYVEVNDAALATETARAQEAEGANSAAISAEVVRAEAAEAVLQGNIDTEAGRIDAILEASEADKDSFAEIVTLINSVDTENDEAFASYVLSNNAALDQARSDFEAADSAATDDRAAIRSEFAAADSVLETAMLAAIGVVQADVDQNESDADAAIAALQADVDGNEAASNEALEAATEDRAAIRSEFAAADSALEAAMLAAIGVVQADVDQNEADADAAIATEQARAELAEQILTDELVKVNDDLAQELADRVAADTVIADDLAQELLDRASGDAAERAFALDARNEMKEELEASISEVAVALSTYETSNDAALASEISTRTTADASLQAQIDALTGDLGDLGDGNAADLAAEIARATGVEAALAADVLALHGRSVMAEMVSTQDFDAGQFVIGQDFFSDLVMPKAVFVNGMRLQSAEFTMDVIDGAFQKIDFLIPVYIGDVIVVDAEKKIDLQS